MKTFSVFLRAGEYCHTPLLTDTPHQHSSGVNMYHTKIEEKAASGHGGWLNNVCMTPDKFLGMPPEVSPHPFLSMSPDNICMDEAIGACTDQHL